MARCQEITTLHIDPDNAMGGTASQIFDSITFIPLETNKESLFGKIAQMEVTEKYFIILDNRVQKIMVFNRDGTFHCKIQTTGDDKYFGYFTLNRKDSEIITTGEYRDKILVYNYGGRLLREVNIPVNLQSIYYFNKNAILFEERRPARITPENNIRYDLAYSDGYSNVNKKLLPYNSKFIFGDYNLYYNTITNSGESSSCIFSVPYDYNVYQLKDTGITHQYKFIFPLKYSLPQNFATDSVYTGSREKFIYYTPENQGKFESIIDTYELGDYLMFTTGYEGRLNSNGNYIYNFKTNNLISFGHVTGDSSSYYFPLLSRQYLERADAVYDNQIFSSIPSIILFSLKNKSEKTITYNSTLEQYFKNGNKNDNLVIVQLKLKKNL